jgi:hypothetical protein
MPRPGILLHVVLDSQPGEILELLCGTLQRTVCAAMLPTIRRNPQSDSSSLLRQTAAIVDRGGTEARCAPRRRKPP